ncbi:MAG: hypothetical protein R2699_05560 [Acidimicrobiales bacterium]
MSSACSRRIRARSASSAWSWPSRVQQAVHEQQRHLVVEGAGVRGACATAGR